MDLLTRPILDGVELQQIQNRLTSDQLPWRDGKLTAGQQAASVKQNSQLAPDSELTQEIMELVSRKLREDPLIKSFCLIRKIHSLLVSKSESGDGYGWHVDNPFSKHGRRDLSFTLFLSDESAYSGGSLEIQGFAESSEFRLPAGHVLIYPSSSIHRVNHITEGVRYVCVGWIESYIKSAEDRALLFGLDAGARGLLARYGRSDELDLIFQAYTNAVRRLSN